MNLHQILFPNCHQQGRVAELEAEIKALRAELKREVNWNRKVADKMITLALTKNGQYGLGAREEFEPAATPTPPAEELPAEYDAAKEAAIDAKVIEFERIYEARGRSVPRPEIRKMVVSNFAYLMDDDRVELMP